MKFFKKRWFSSSEEKKNLTKAIEKFLDEKLVECKSFEDPLNKLFDENESNIQSLKNIELLVFKLEKKIIPWHRRTFDSAWYHLIFGKNKNYEKTKEIHKKIAELNKKISDAHEEALNQYSKNFKEGEISTLVKNNEYMLVTSSIKLTENAKTLMKLMLGNNSLQQPTTEYTPGIITIIKNAHKVCEAYPDKACKAFNSIPTEGESAQDALAKNKEYQNLEAHYRLITTKEVEKKVDAECAKDRALEALKETSLRTPKPNHPKISRESSFGTPRRPP